MNRKNSVVVVLTMVIVTFSFVFAMFFLNDASPETAYAEEYTYAAEDQDLAVIQQQLELNQVLLHQADLETHTIERTLSVINSTSITEPVFLTHTVLYFPIISDLNGLGEGPGRIVSFTVPVDGFLNRGWGETFESAWENQKPNSLEYNQMLAEVSPVADTLFMPIDYGLARSMLSAQVQEGWEGTVVSATLTFEAGCSHRIYGDIQQPEHYVLKLASWDENATPEELWYPAPYEVDAPILAEIPLAKCVEQESADQDMSVSIELAPEYVESAISDGGKLQMVLIHPDERINLRDDDNATADQRATMEVRNRQGFDNTLTIYASVPSDDS